MSLHIKPGEVYTTFRVRSGESANGRWELMVIKDEKGKKELTVWASNPEVEIPDGGQVKIISIDEAVSAARKDGNGNWHDQFSINATIERVASASPDFDAGGDVPPWEDVGTLDGELPF